MREELLEEMKSLVNALCMGQYVTAARLMDRAKITLMYLMQEQSRDPGHMPKPVRWKYEVKA